MKWCKCIFQTKWAENFFRNSLVGVLKVKARIRTKWHGSTALQRPAGLFSAWEPYVSSFGAPWWRVFSCAVENFSVISCVGDPDPYVFGTSGSVSTRYGSDFWSFYLSSSKNSLELLDDEGFSCAVENPTCLLRKKSLHSIEAPGKKIIYHECSIFHSYIIRHIAGQWKKPQGAGYYTEDEIMSGRPFQISDADCTTNNRSFSMKSGIFCEYSSLRYLGLIIRDLKLSLLRKW